MKKSNHKDDDKRAVILKGTQDTLHHVKADPTVRLHSKRGRNKFNIRRWPRNVKFTDDGNFKVFKPGKTLDGKSKSGSHSLPELHNFKTGSTNKP
jgi:hypothetical protein